jgi:hypothetical protein
MAIPGSGQIDLTDLADEFGGTAPHGLSEYYRGGGLVPDSPTNSAIPTSGQIALGNFYGSANVVNLTVTRTTTGNSINVYSAVAPNPAYVAGATNVTYKINPGVTIGSPAIGTNSITVPASFASGDSVSIVNNGYIAGKGGNGGATTPTQGQVGQTGGNALRLYRPTSITNSGVIAGGGGGGGASNVVTGYNFKPGYGQAIIQGQFQVAGASGGGGAGRNVGQGGLQVSTGTRAGNGSSTTGGAGRPRVTNGSYYSGKGGNGGNRGVNGQASENGSTPGTKAGGTRGYYIQGNPYATWVSNGTRLGRSQ